MVGAPRAWAAATSCTVAGSALAPISVTIRPAAASSRNAAALPLWLASTTYEV